MRGGMLMAAVKVASAKFIEATLEKIERELEEAQGPRKQELQKLLARVYPIIRTLGRHTVH
jgi:hypothetical protein